MLKWDSKEIINKTLLATRKGMDSVMSKCVGAAKADVSKVTTALQGSIRIGSPAALKGNEVVGVWGSYGIKYAIYIETGTDPYVIRPVKAKALFWPGAAHPVKVVHHPGIKAHPFLRPAADRFYPALPSEIKRFMA